VWPELSGTAGGRFYDLSDNEAQILFELPALISFVEINLYIRVCLTS